MVGGQIAVLRRGAGMTQAELARHIHVSASAIGMYEQGRRLPAAPILIALSRVFDVTIDYLVTGVPCARKDIARSHPTVKKDCENGDFGVDRLDTFAMLEDIAYLYSKII